MSDRTALPVSPDERGPSGFTRRHALRKLAYVAPAVVALEIVTAQTAFGQSGPLVPRPPVLPEIKVPNITLPEITLPEITLPGIRPATTAPAAVAPATTVSSGTMVVTHLPSTGSGSAADED